LGEHKEDTTVELSPRIEWDDAATDDGVVAVAAPVGVVVCRRTEASCFWMLPPLNLPPAGVEMSKISIGCDGFTLFF
jgi:hypothetical protein